MLDPLDLDVLRAKGETDTHESTQPPPLLLLLVLLPFLFVLMHA